VSFNLRKLSELWIGKQYQIKISNRFAAWENFNYSEDISRVWENINENIETSVKESLALYELKQQNHGWMKNVQGFKSKETGLNAVVTGCKPQQCR
jgi:hypothetical protein